LTLLRESVKRYRDIKQGGGGLPETVLPPLLPAELAPLAGDSQVSSRPTGDASQGALLLAGMEVAPLALAVCEEVADLVCRCGGGSLWIDYGEDYSQLDTLRAFAAHTQVPFLSMPGAADVTADVDFSLCAAAARARGAVVWPLLSQGQFLLRMGIVQRVQQLVDLDTTSEEQAEELVAAAKRLIGGREGGEGGDRPLPSSVLAAAPPPLVHGTTGGRLTPPRPLAPQAPTAAADLSNLGTRFKVMAICHPSMSCPGFT
jgi:SAM-dependent MidA family methyltransferase